MPGVQLAGLVSGVDWTTLITSIVNADRVPETAMKAEQTTIANKLNGFSTLKSQLADLTTSLTALQNPALFSARSVTQSNAALNWTASAGPNTPAGQYKVAFSQLATTASRVGAAAIGRGLSASSNVGGLTMATLPTATAVTAGNFQVNGATVAVSLTDSLQDVFTKISAATGGAVTASYDPAADHVTLTSTSGALSLGAANDTSNFLSAFKLSNNGSATVSGAGNLGSTQLNKPLNQSHLLAAIGNTDPTGAGSFQINGVSLSYNVNTDSLQSIMQKVNASSAGVTASYDASTDKFSLTNNVSGNLGLAVSETSGGLLDAMGIGAGATVNGGSDAHYTVNGGADTVSHSNSIIDQSGLSVTGTSLDTQTIAVSSDGTNATAAIKDFIAKYNTIQTAIAAQTKITVGTDGKVTNSLFSGDRDVADLGRSLRQMAFASVPGLNGGASMRLQNMGIDFTPGTSTLAITDPTALSNALANQGAAVANVFQNSTSGLTTQFNAFIAKTTQTHGSFDVKTTSMNKRTASITQQINDLERRLTAEQDSLTAEFTQMESIQAQLKSSASTLTSAFSSNNNSSN